ncbi:MAG: PQQ-dependent sugar dehydrogenase [Anaeromyxobacteraceae bacterium]
MIAHRRFAAASVLAVLSQVSCRQGGGAERPVRPSNATCVAPALPASDASVDTPRAFPNVGFDEPLDVLQAPDDPSRVFVVQKQGIVKVFPNDPDASSSEVYVDLTAEVSSTASEAGLLGMAFHPRFAENGQVFLSYTGFAAGGGLRSVVSRFHSTDGGLTLDPATEEILIAEDKQNTRHNGGTLAFGPDGFLYIGIGDDGGPHDETNPAQDLTSLLGKLLRIDVNAPAGYAIPAGNPFAGGGARPEIYALGLRNPWRFSFDRATGELWVGDVGEDAWEEVDRIVPGGNYGWPIREGNHCLFDPACSAAGLIPPVVEYPHAEGVAITGGVVYRGSDLPALAGRYLFADFVSGKLWALTSDAATGAPVAELLANTGQNLVAFGELSDGEVLAVDMGTGTLRRLAPAAPPASTAAFPQTLRATGCFDPANPTRPVEALLPYDVNAALWADGADKERYFAIPDGTRIHVGADGDWDFPEGSVLVKTFLLGGRRVETRLLMRHPGGTWAGYSYEWNDAQDDAALLSAGRTKAVAGQTWSFPSRAECMECHTGAAGRSLGLETAQLDRAPAAGGANQLTTLDALGVLDAQLAPASPGAAHLAAPGGPDGLEARARAYLHANCSNCHRPSGPGGGPADLRYTTPLRDMRVCDVAPDHGDLGIGGARILAPGAPARSMLSARMHQLGTGHMPPLGTREVDAAGVSLVDGWIASLGACP